jgi:hypothetical protein
MSSLLKKSHRSGAQPVMSRLGTPLQLSEDIQVRSRRRLLSQSLACHKAALAAAKARGGKLGGPKLAEARKAAVKVSSYHCWLISRRQSNRM